MANKNFIERLSSAFTQSATVKNVFGDPIQVGEKTLLPVAKFSYGFGGGFGKRKKMQLRSKLSANNEMKKNPGGSGAGGGGGIRASAAGVFEITPKRTRFIAAHPYRHVLAGVLLGFFLNHLFHSGKRS